VDGSDALKSGLPEFPINPGANLKKPGTRIKNKIPQVKNVLILIKDN
jgi:hypothetical protein